MSNEDTDNLIRLAEYQKKGGGVISEHTVALAFTEEHRGKLRFDHDIGKWFCWNDQIWLCERTLLAFNWSRDIAARLVEGEDDKTRRAAAGTASQPGSRNSPAPIAPSPVPRRYGTAMVICSERPAAPSNCAPANCGRPGPRIL
jgi:hypothetical protein